MQRERYCRRHSGYDKLIIVKNGSGAVSGTHTIICIQRGAGSPVWYSFYLENPGGGSSSSGSSSGSSSSGGGSGIGVVSSIPPAKKGSTGAMFDITSAQADDLDGYIRGNRDKRKRGKGRKYDLQTYNCVEWASTMINTTLGEDYPPYGNGQDGTSGKIPTPNGYLRWSLVNYPNDTGTWHP